MEAIKVNFYATLRQIVGQKNIELPFSKPLTVKELVSEVIRLYPGLERELIDPQGELYQHVHVLINGRDAFYLDNELETLLTNTDTVNIFPAVGGG